MIDSSKVGVKLPELGVAKGVAAIDALGDGVRLELGVAEDIGIGERLGDAVGFIVGVAEGVETKDGPSEA